MHIIIGLLTSLVTILFLLDRLGIDIGGLNPFYWARRRAWAKKYEGDPIYSVEKPVDVAACLIIGVAKMNGDLTTEQKQLILQLFEDKFSLSSKASSELFIAATHLLGSPQILDNQLRQLAERRKESFSPEQANSLLELIEKTAAPGMRRSTPQTDLITHIRTVFAEPEKADGEWAS